MRLFPFGTYIKRVRVGDIYTSLNKTNIQIHSMSFIKLILSEKTKQNNTYVVMFGPHSLTACGHLCSRLAKDNTQKIMVQECTT